jgi:dolichol-phosphate mannosyltransferase
MSGFFMLRRRTFQDHEGYQPIGYKIGLELLVKCGCEQVVEIPIHFTDRRLGKSKLSFQEQLRYLQHIRRLYNYKFGMWSQLAQFLAVGASGLVVNLLLLTLFLGLGLGERIAPIPAIALSMVWNFALNRRFSFSASRDQPMLQQFWRFVSACSLGAVVNYLVTLLLLRLVTAPQIAATVGVVAATGFNFAASRMLVFRQKHVVKK